MQDKIDLEKQVCELQGKIVMVQCQNRLLIDKLDTYQTVAEKVAVCVTQYKYQKQRGWVNQKKVHTAITEAGRNWDPEKWDGDVRDSTDLDSSSEGEVFVEAKPILWRKLEHDPPGHPVRWDVVEDFTQHTINDIMDRFKQKPGGSLLSWAIRSHDLGALGVKLDPDDVKKFAMLSSDSFVQDTWDTKDETNLLAVVVEGCSRKYPTEGE